MVQSCNFHRLRRPPGGRPGLPQEVGRPQNAPVAPPEITHGHYVNDGRNTNYVQSCNLPFLL